MEENRYFRFVWRVNGVAIMLLLVFIMVIGGYNLITEMMPKDGPVVITNIADDPMGDEKWSLGKPEKIDGTQFVYMPLVSEKKNISIPVPASSKKALHSYGGGYFAPSRNLLFANKKTREIKWLFKNNGQLIADIDMLSTHEQFDKDRKIDAILYQIIKKDTNADGQLTSEDLADIAISYPDGSHYTEIFQTVERIFGAMSLEGKDILVLYQSKGKGYASTILLQNMSVLETKEIPKTDQML